MPQRDFGGLDSPVDVTHRDTPGVKPVTAQAGWMRDLRDRVEDDPRMLSLPLGMVRAVKRFILLAHVLSLIPQPSGDVNPAGFPLEVLESGHPARWK